MKKFLPSSKTSFFFLPILLFTGCDSGQNLFGGLQLPNRSTASGSPTPTATPASTPTPTPIPCGTPTQWDFVDGDIVNGIADAQQPSFGSVNSKLYLTMGKWLGTANTSVYVYNGDDSAPTWTEVDGGGLNQNAAVNTQYPRLLTLGSTLYSAWAEDVTATGHIFLKSYNGNDSAPAWTLMNGGALNFDNTQNAQTVRGATIGTKLYLIWTEISAGTGNSLVRGKVYDGSTFTEYDGGSNGLNIDPANNDGLYPAVAAFNNKIYVVWSEFDSNTYFKNVIHAKVYDPTGSTWTLVDGGSNLGLSYNAVDDSLNPELMVANSKLYVTWSENGFSHVRAFNGNDSSPVWTLTDSALGINANSSKLATFPILAASSCQLFAMWNENDTAAKNVRFSTLDATNGWTLIDPANGLNEDFTESTVDNTPAAYYFNGKVYTSWDEYGTNGQGIRVRVGH